jgi:hypothetical protein
MTIGEAVASETTVRTWLLPGWTTKRLSHCGYLISASV